ncbi:MAG: ATP-dependent Clp protease adapter ClpS [Desulfobacteraceae bacterium]|nr:MAG: ATP-dependent Clp protease adapter ClpS [Desulfobacteraceae bacterium]
MNGFSPATRDEVVSRTRDKITEPPMYKVLLHNDDYTTMDFVVEVLMGVFHKSFEEATMIMLSVHKTGTGVCGIYTYEIAETKSEIIQEMARDRGFPLKSSIEKA